MINGVDNNRTGLWLCVGFSAAVLYAVSSRKFAPKAIMQMAQNGAQSLPKPHTGGNYFATLKDAMVRLTDKEIKGAKDTLKELQRARDRFFTDRQPSAELKSIIADAQTAVCQGHSDMLDKIKIAVRALGAAMASVARK